MAFEDMSEPQLAGLLALYAGGLCASIGIFVLGCLKGLGAVRVERPAWLFASTGRALAASLAIAAALVLIDMLVRNMAGEQG